MITTDLMEESLEFIARHASALGERWAALDYTEFKSKQVHSEQYLQAEGAVVSRQAVATTSEPYRKAVEDHRDVRAEYKTLQTEYKYHELVISAWQSQQANLRARNV